MCCTQTRVKTDPHLEPVCFLASSRIIPMLFEVFKALEVIIIQKEPDPFAIFCRRYNEDSCIGVVVMVEKGGH